MLARANLDQFAAAEAALSHARLLEVLGRLPYRQLHFAARSLAFTETWLRWPLRTLRMLDWVDERISLADPDGRLGLDREFRSRFRKNLLYDAIADLAVLITRLDDARFRRRALVVEGREGLDRERERGPGAIVMGFRVGAYPVAPLALGALGYDVFMIVGSTGMIRLSSGLTERFTPRAHERLRYTVAQDSLALAKAVEALNQGSLVATLMDLSPIKYQKTTPVRFFDWEIRVPYGIPYLAAVSQRSIVPALLVREKGPRYRLRLLEPLPPPARERASIFATTQALYDALESELRRYPDQWAGWTMLESHLGINLSRAAPTPAVAAS